MADAGNCAARTNARHKEIHLTVGVCVDFRTGRFKVRFWIRGVDKLSGDKTVRNFFGKRFCFFNRALHAFCAFGKHQLRTVCLHQLATFDRHGIRHHDDEAVPAGSGDRCQADPGIAGGRFNDGRPRFEYAALFCIVNHGLGDTVFDRSGRVQVFQFCKHARL